MRLLKIDARFFVLVCNNAVADQLGRTVGVRLKKMPKPQEN